jgi:predicted nucleotidyltransferase component of viral defense system
LDFSRIKDFPFTSFKAAISDIERKYSELDIRDVTDKFYTYIAQYRIKEPWRPIALSVKIEVSKRIIKKDEKIYELINLKSPVSNVEALGNVMRAENIYKEKMQAIETRDQPRDLFDLWYLSNLFKKPYNPPTDKFEKRVLVRDLRKYLPNNYWKVIDTLQR